MLALLRSDKVTAVIATIRVLSCETNLIGRLSLILMNYTWIFQLYKNIAFRKRTSQVCSADICRVGRSVYGHIRRG